MPELLPTAKRDAFLAELVDTEPAGNELLIKGWGKRTIGPRTMRRMLDAEAEVERLRAKLANPHLINLAVGGNDMSVELEDDDV